jgi:hypothetical protein
LQIFFFFFLQFISDVIYVSERKIKSIILLSPFLLCEVLCQGKA